MDEGGTLDGGTAFKLYDTYGFPDLTEDALRSRGITVDKEGFDAAMEQQKPLPGRLEGFGAVVSEEIWFDLADTQGSTEFTGYNSTTGEAEVVAIVKDGAQVQSAEAGDEVVVLQPDPVLWRSGGQTGDAGRIWTPRGSNAVETTNKPLGRLRACRHADRGSVKVGDAVHLEVDASGVTIRANHSATPRPCSTAQSGRSRHAEGLLVSEDRFRFDFSHPKPLSEDDIRVEAG